MDSDPVVGDKKVQNRVLVSRVPCARSDLDAEIVRVVQKRCKTVWFASLLCNLRLACRPSNKQAVARQYRCDFTAFRSKIDVFLVDRAQTSNPRSPSVFLVDRARTSNPRSPSSRHAVAEQSPSRTPTDPHELGMIDSCTPCRIYSPKVGCRHKVIFYSSDLGAGFLKARSSQIVPGTLECHAAPHLVALFGVGLAVLATPQSECQHHSILEHIHHA